MKVLVCGASGYVGQKLVPHLLSNFHQVTVLGRNQAKLQKQFPSQVAYADWGLFSLDAATQEQVKSFDVIINLAGVNIGAKRWGDKFKSQVLNSRIQTTQKIVAACVRLKQDAPALFSASAISVYGLSTDETESLKEESTKINFYEDGNFLEEVARSWEQVTWPLRDAGIRVVNMRFGVVVDKQSKVLQTLLLPYRLFVGGVIGSGTQGFSWISRADLVQAIGFLLQHSEVSGPVNFVAPAPLSYRDLAHQIGDLMHRSNWLPKPAWQMRFLLGKERADCLLLLGTYAYPAALLKAGFTFRYKKIDQVITKALSS